jgi:tRNA(Ile)-lysidine synthase
VSFTPERLLRALEDCLAAARDPRPSGCCVALSGGLDSSVLLAGLVQLRDEGKLTSSLRAVHVDHALHADSARWSESCRAFATSKSVPFIDLRVDAAAAPGESPEAAARAARYAALKGNLAAGEVLLTAHHADDQLETILLQWLRGGGLQAVAGMRPLARFGPGWQARPLLDLPRAELQSWAVGQGIAWLEDPSNRDTRFDRNYLRLAVLPVVRARWPAVARTAGRVAEFAAEALELERQIAATDLRHVADGAALSLPRLMALADARQRAVLRAWLRALALPVPPARTLEALRHDMSVAAADRIPVVRWPGAIVRRYRQRLYAEVPVAGGLASGDWRVGSAAEWPLPQGARLELVAGTGLGLSRERLPPTLRVTARGEGADFRPAGGSHRRPLRKWFQDRGVLPWRRDSIPLLCADGEIVAIADISCAAPYAAGPDEPSWRIRWHGRPLLTEGEVLAFNWPDHPPIH